MSITERDQLRSAFERTRYITEYGSVHVHQELPVGLLHWMDDEQATTLAVLGAENPRGTATSPAINQQAHDRLEAVAAEKGLRFIEAIGELDAWRERHLVVIGCSREDAIRIGVDFDQAAILWCERDAVVEIVWCQAPYQ